jgi:hypothetical protein
LKATAASFVYLIDIKEDLRSLLWSDQVFCECPTSFDHSISSVAIDSRSHSHFE